MLRRAQTTDLRPDELGSLRRLLDEAFEGEFADTDWANSLGGTHVIVEDAGTVVSHASVVARRLVVGDRTLLTGYVEAVATRPGSQRRGLATRAMEEIRLVIGEEFEVGALSTGRPSLYARLGWEPWRGPTFAETPDGTTVRTADEDGGIMVLRTPATGALDLGAPITCDWRPGNVW